MFHVAQDRYLPEVYNSVSSDCIFQPYNARNARKRIQLSDPSHPGNPIEPSNPSQPDNFGETNLRQQLPNTLSPRGLTIALVSLTLIPFFFVVLLYRTQPITKDPVLDVSLVIAPRQWHSEDGTQTRLLPSMVVRNPTDEIWKNVNFAVNDQFYYYHPDPMRAGEELVVPLKFFHTKGNQFYPPENQPLKSITVYAQIATGARAIRKFTSSEIALPQ